MIDTFPVEEKEQIAWHSVAHAIYRRLIYPEPHISVATNKNVPDKNHQKQILVLFDKRGLIKLGRITNDQYSVRILDKEKFKLFFDELHVLYLVAKSKIIKAKLGLANKEFFVDGVHFPLPKNQYALLSYFTDSGNVTGNYIHITKWIVKSKLAKIKVGEKESWIKNTKRSLQDRYIKQFTAGKPAQLLVRAGRGKGYQLINKDIVQKV